MFLSSNLCHGCPRIFYDQKSKTVPAPGEFAYFLFEFLSTSFLFFLFPFFFNVNLFRSLPWFAPRLVTSVSDEEKILTSQEPYTTSDRCSLFSPPSLSIRDLFDVICVCLLLLWCLSREWCFLAFFLSMNVLMFFWCQPPHMYPSLRLMLLSAPPLLFFQARWPCKPIKTCFTVCFVSNQKPRHII